MPDQHDTAEMTETLESFVGLFDQYAEEVFGEHRRPRLDRLRSQLQKAEPKVTSVLLEVLGPRDLRIPHVGTIGLRDLFVTILAGSNNELPLNFGGFGAADTSILSQALGTIEAGLLKEAAPILTIRDHELADRCLDLLSAPGNYDRVVREATTVLEDRIRSKVTCKVLAALIPNAADQTGENLVNRVFAPDKAVLIASSEEHKRIAFHRILLGTVSYLRNPYHHQLEANTEWSWAWSVTGLIDKLLAEVESPCGHRACRVARGIGRTKCPEACRPLL
jgi:hypothetical protein